MASERRGNVNLDQGLAAAVDAPAKGDSGLAIGNILPIYPHKSILLFCRVGSVCAAKPPNRCGKDKVHLACKPKGCDIPQMPSSFRQFVIVLALALPACGLSGCGTINQTLTPVVVDAIPQWAGGLSAHAPPRPG